jgi:hypothetical protein
MDIMNVLPEDRFAEVDDFLAFVSIYDDENRIKSYFSFLEKHKSLIEGKVCAELGAGMGIISEKLISLGAERVYAVEKNPYLFEITKERLDKYKNAVVVNKDILDFVPEKNIDFAVHEFYGQLLFDEEIFLLEKLKWTPQYLFPNGGKLMGGVIDVAEFDDDVINSSTIKHIDGALVSGLFDEEDVPLMFDVAKYQYGEKIPRTFTCDISQYEGDLLYLGLVILHDGNEICRAGVCDNWSYVWTYRKGNKFKLEFDVTERGTDVYFEWIG